MRYWFPDCGLKGTVRQSIDTADLRRSSNAARLSTSPNRSWYAMRNALNSRTACITANRSARGASLSDQVATNMGDAPLVAVWQSSTKSANFDTQQMPL